MALWNARRMIMAAPEGIEDINQAQQAIITTNGGLMGRQSYAGEVVQFGLDERKPVSRPASQSPSEGRLEQYGGPLAYGGSQPAAAIVSQVDRERNEKLNKMKQNRERNRERMKRNERNVVTTPATGEAYDIDKVLKNLGEEEEDGSAQKKKSSIKRRKSNEKQQSSATAAAATPMRAAAADDEDEVDDDEGDKADEEEDDDDDGSNKRNNVRKDTVEQSSDAVELKSRSTEDLYFTKVTSKKQKWKKKVSSTKDDSSSSSSSSSASSTVDNSAVSRRSYNLRPSLRGKDLDLKADFPPLKSPGWVDTNDNQPNPAVIDDGEAVSDPVWPPPVASGPNAEPANLPDMARTNTAGGYNSSGMSHVSSSSASASGDVTPPYGSAKAKDATNFQIQSFFKVDSSDDAESPAVEMLDADSSADIGIEFGFGVSVIKLADVEEPAATSLPHQEDEAIVGYEPELPSNAEAAGCNYRDVVSFVDQGWRNVESEVKRGAFMYYQDGQQPRAAEKPAV